MEDTPSQRSSPSSSRSPSTTVAPPVPVTFVVGIVLVACSKLAVAWIAALAVGSKDPKSAAPFAAFASNVATVGITVAAWGLVSIALDRRIDRVVAAASLFGAVVLIAAAFTS